MEERVDVGGLRAIDGCEDGVSVEDRKGSGGVGGEGELTKELGWYEQLLMPRSKQPLACLRSPRLHSPRARGCHAHALATVCGPGNFEIVKGDPGVEGKALRERPGTGEDGADVGCFPLVLLH